MSQLKITASVTNGSQTVTVPGVDVSAQIKATHVFMISPDFVAYWVAADATFDGTDTHFNLTGNYLAATNAAAAGIVCRDATQSNIPTLAQGDVGTAAVFTAAMFKIEALLSGATPVAGGGTTGGSTLTSTDFLPEGTTNLYFTNQRAQAAVPPPPLATAAVAGLIKVGANLSITAGGVLSATVPSGAGGGTVTNVTVTAPLQVSNGASTPALSITPATATAPGTMSAADFSKLQGVAPNANNFTYALPIASTTVLGGIKLGAGLTADVNGVVSLSVASGTIVSTTAPLNPPNGQQWMNLSDGITYTWVVDADSGQWVELGPTTSDNNAYARSSIWLAAGNSTVMTVQGNQPLNAVGTATAANITTANKQTWLRRIEYLVTVADVAAVAGFNLPAAQWARGTTAGYGGFKMTCRFGPATGVATATTRCFVGMCADTTTPTDVNPSTLLDMAGFGWDAGDANIQFFHNDAAGAAVKVDLGVNFPRPSIDRTEMYEVFIGCLPADTQISYQITNLTNGVTASGSVSTDLPTATTLLAPRGRISAGGTSSVIGLSLASLSIETDY